MKNCGNSLTSDGIFRTFRVGVLMVTNSSAAVGWIPTVASKSALVNPAFTAIANPWNPYLRNTINNDRHEYYHIKKIDLVADKITTLLQIAINSTFESW